MLKHDCSASFLAANETARYAPLTGNATVTCLQQPACSSIYVSCTNHFKHWQPVVGI